MLVAGTWIAVRAAIWVLIPAMLALPLTLKIMRRTLVAANKILIARGDYWESAWMPVVLLAMLGGVLGAALVWRITSAASIGRLSVWVVAGPAIMVITLTGFVALVIIFTPAVPVLGWIALAGFATGALVCAHLTLHWIG